MVRFSEIEKGDEIQVGKMDTWFKVESISSNHHGVNIYTNFPAWDTTHIHRMFITDHKKAKCKECGK